jgi:protein-S-isoprenylcysteine O-methyltransferase Ste14
MLTLPVKIMLICVSSAAYLGLAILGWGGFAAFFSHPPLTAVAIVFLILSIAGIFVGGSLSPGVREDRGNRWVLIPFTVLALLSAYLPAYTDRHSFWIIGGNAVRWLGVVLFAVGGALRLWPVVVLGHRFSGLVAIQPGHRLVTSGIYSVIRNPSYLGLTGNALGWSLAFRSGTGILLTLLFIPPLIARMRAEETLLRSEFGAEYDAYCARTYRLIPWLY